MYKRQYIYWYSTAGGWWHRAVREKKRFREIFASSLDYMGIVAPEHLSPCRSSMVLATRETRHVLRFRLGGLSLGVIFSSRWLGRSRSSTAISQTATTFLVLDEAKIVVAQHRSCSHSRRNIHKNHILTARGDASGEPGWVAGHSKQHRSCCLLGR